MRWQARCRRNAERPHTMVPAKEPAATTKTMIVLVIDSSCAPANADLQRRRAEAEVLSDLALDEAKVRGRLRLVGEEGERGRVGGALRRVEDAARGRRVHRLRLLHHPVQLTGGNASVVGLD